MSRQAHGQPTSASALLRSLLLLLALTLAASGCLSGDTTSDDDAVDDDEVVEEEGEAGEEPAADPEPEDEPAGEDEPEESDAPIAEEEEEGEEADDPAQAADGDDVAAVVAARDSALDALPSDWTASPNDPVEGPEGVDAEDDPLNECLPDGLEDLEGQVDELQTVSASGDFTAPATGEEAFGPASGSVTVNAYSDPGAAQDLLRQFGDAVSDPSFSDCVVAATSEEFGEPPEGSEFDVQVLPGVDGIDSEVALQILVSASFGGETVNFDAIFVLASRGDYIVEGQFTGDGENAFPLDVATAVLDATA